MTTMTTVDFGQALKQLKAGEKVCRIGWNGKGMFLWIKKGSIDGDMLGFAPGENPLSDHPSTMDGIKLGHFECGDKGTTTRLPCLCMHTATGATVEGWLASQTDMLADDWMIVE